GQSDLPLAYMPKFDKVTLLQMEGIMTQKETEEAVKMAVEGCKKIYEIQKETLKKKYGMIQGEAVAAEDLPEEQPESSEEPTEDDKPAEEEEQ
ncbi:MAG: exosome complex exonuclease Rrp41, partial [Candidatus Bathyarchaeota archaeon]